MSIRTQQQPQELATVFVHSALDEAGLSAAEFRLYCHLARRTDNVRGVAVVGHESMASMCRLEIKTIRRALAALGRRGMIAVERTPGYPNAYKLTPRSRWQADPDASEFSDGPAVAPRRTFASASTAYRHPGCQPVMEGVGQTGTWGIPSTPYEGNPCKVIQEDNPRTHTTQEPAQTGVEVQLVCAPAAGFSASWMPSVEPRPGGREAMATGPMARLEPPKKAPKEADSAILERFAAFWERLRPELRGDRQPALEAFQRLDPDAAELERIALHREVWEKRAADSESGTAGWVPKPKHVANYLRVRQFDSLLPEPRPLRPVRSGGSAPAYIPPPPSPEAVRIAELKRLGIVALDLMNGKALLDERYGFAVEVLDPVDHAQIIAIEDRLLQLHKRFSTD